ncbi:SBBP repeat-containing protein [Persicitalea sp.]|uniref:SBBP repeat-containing protein n=1 Tax=Persicitalea sp. TaxID=3100273 RepID=UPI0035939408
MKTKVFILFTLIGVVTNSCKDHLPDPAPVVAAFENKAWNAIGGSSSGEAIAVDALGNVYVVGDYKFSVAFDQVSLDSGVERMPFLAKYNPLGKIMWVEQIGISGAASGLALDNNGNVYVTGFFGKAADYDRSLVNGKGRVILIKYDQNGKLVWLNAVGTEEKEQGIAGRGIAIDRDGNIALTGYFSGTAAFGKDVFKSLMKGPQSESSSDGFITKISSDGSFQWAKQVGGNDDDQGYHVAIDPEGNVVASGIFTDKASFEGTTLTGESKKYYGNNYLVKYNGKGDLKWVTKEFGGPLVTDVNGNIFTTTLTETGFDIVKLSKGGNVEWRKEGSRSGFSSLAASSDGNIYLTSNFTSQTTIEGQTFKSEGLSDILLVKYSTNGNFQWARRDGGKVDEIPFAITLGNNGNIYLTGTLAGELKPTKKVSITLADTPLESEGSNMFVTRYKE